MKNQLENYTYCPSLTSYVRRMTREVKVGDLGIGGEQPIRIQSMTTVDTMDTQGSIDQSIRMIEAGCELVRITAPSLKEAENLRNIKEGLIAKGYKTPLVADIHFTPNAAELAARLVEKVRINPGNYVDKKKFKVIEYNDITYQDEIDRIRNRFSPLVKICKEYGTAMRIGTNHGSLSDRIMSRYGDTPLGMVESALEFLRICEDLNYYDVILSMKASNTQVMVEAYRLLVNKLNQEKLQAYPLHLGVTEAGEGEDGRIKSAVGIGTLLEDGMGDTVRVSLTEDPEFEAPVAKMLVDRYSKRSLHQPIPELNGITYNPFSYHRRETNEVANFGYKNVPRVIADFSEIQNLDVKDLKTVGHFYLSALDKWTMNDLGCDYLYIGNQDVPFMFPNGLKAIVDIEKWMSAGQDAHSFPMFNTQQLSTIKSRHTELNFIQLDTSEVSEEMMALVKREENLVMLLSSKNEHAMPDIRRVIVELNRNDCSIPVVIQRTYANISEEELQLYAATDVGGLLIDGLGDGIMLNSKSSLKETASQSNHFKSLNNTAFGILQAARTRMSKTEYISCPSCGRTLFDLQETTAMIRQRTDHLKGVKIGIMGCIVNGPGEMADADYGYVGSGKGKITLYRGQEVMKKSVPSEEAVDELIKIIKEDGRWVAQEIVEHN